MVHKTRRSFQIIWKKVQTLPAGLVKQPSTALLGIHFAVSPAHQNQRIRNWKRKKYQPDSSYFPINMSVVVLYLGVKKLEDHWEYGWKLWCTLPAWLTQDRWKSALTPAECENMLDLKWATHTQLLNHQNLYKSPTSIELILYLVYTIQSICSKIYQKKDVKIRVICESNLMHTSSRIPTCISKGGKHDGLPIVTRMTI